MNVYDKAELAEMEDEHDFIDKMTIGYAIIFILLCCGVAVIRFLTPKGHFKELLICFVLALIVSAFVIVSLLYWARYASA